MTAIPGFSSVPECLRRLKTHGVTTSGCAYDDPVGMALAAQRIEAGDEVALTFATASVKARTTDDWQCVQPSDSVVRSAQTFVADQHALRRIDAVITGNESALGAQDVALKGSISKLLDGGASFEIERSGSMPIRAQPSLLHRLFNRTRVEQRDIVETLRISKEDGKMGMALIMHQLKSVTSPGAYPRRLYLCSRHVHQKVSSSEALIATAQHVES